MSEKKEVRLPEIGYLYHYPKLGRSEDPFQLDVFISSTPTEKHFDVYRLRVIAKNPHAKLENYSILHPWHYSKEAEVCAGVVIMEDRNGAREEAFTFGGSLSIEVKELQTNCFLTSPAPILEISHAAPVDKLFIDEVELLLAEYRVNFTAPFAFEEKLFEIDPFDLYIACLFRIVDKFEQFPKRDEMYERLLVQLHAQLHRLDAVGLIKKVHPTLEELFED